MGARIAGSLVPREPISPRLDSQFGDNHSPARHGEWGSSSVGRARRSQCRGQGFDPPLLHHHLLEQGLTARRGQAATQACYTRALMSLRTNIVRRRAKLGTAANAWSSAAATSACCLWNAASKYDAMIRTVSLRTVERSPYSPSAGITVLPAGTFIARKLRSASSRARAASSAAVFAAPATN